MIRPWLTAADFGVRDSSFCAIIFVCHIKLEKKVLTVAQATQPLKTTEQ
jgi:hypothetical protein